MDVTLMRLLWAIVAVMTGFFPGFIAYIVAWIVMPEAPRMLTAGSSVPVTNP
jgi:phage shock protein PspC (stress-responsive transcriptional regulator)